MKRLLSFALSILLVFSFALPASAATSFTDIKGTEWYASAVTYCAENNYMSGIGGGKFDPDGKVTRAQMAQILYNFAGKPDASKLDNPFTDVPGNAWYADAVKFARATGIVSGTSKTTYSPGSNITREQVAVMLLGYYKASTGETPAINHSVLDVYIDKNNVSSWAKDAIAWAIDKKLMSGIGNNKLDPKGTCTRAQLAQFIKNYCQNVGKPGIITPTVDPIVKALIGDTQPLDKDWLPVGGYTQGGRKYNMYGIDITDVDGIPDVEEVKLINMINDYRAANGLPRLQWNQHAQIMSEVRARESAYMFEHARPDGTTLYTDDHLMVSELKINDNMIDANMVANGKTANLNKAYAFCENIGTGRSIDMYVDQFNGWKKSPGHNNTMLDTMNDLGAYGYIACAFAVDPYTYSSAWSYNAYGIDWVDGGSSIVTPTEPPKYDPNPNEDWYPGQGINYNALGFTITDIPAEYPDWILRDPDMDIDDYGPTDHDLNTLEAWLVDNGIEADSDLMYQIKAHYLNAQTMDDYIKFMVSKTEAWHYKNMLPGEWSDIEYMDAVDIRSMKATLVEAVADKMAYQHMAETNHSDYKCDVCGKNHNELRNLSAAETVVNQFFMDTYGFDISAY